MSYAESWQAALAGIEFTSRQAEEVEAAELPYSTVFLALAGVIGDVPPEYARAVVMAVTDVAALSGLTQSAWGRQVAEIVQEHDINPKHSATVRSHGMALRRVMDATQVSFSSTRKLGGRHISRGGRRR